MTTHIQATADFDCFPEEDESNDKLRSAIFLDDTGCELRLDAGPDFQPKLLEWLRQRSEPGERIEIECELGAWVFISRACFFPALADELEGRQVRYAFLPEPTPAPAASMSL